MSITIVYDTTHANIHLLPPGAQAAGYTTGTGGIQWSAADWAAHPGALRIDQDPAASDATADYLDVEQGAATFADCPGWYKRALASYESGKRPGQRWPGIYASASNLTNVANAFIAGGVKSGPRLIVANWNLTQAQAVALVAAAGGPFPVVGVQFRDPGPYDINVMSTAWLDAMSEAPVVPPPATIVPSRAQIARAYETGRAASQVGKLMIGGVWYRVELVRQ